jgi:hypothetical protein
VQIGASRIISIREEWLIIAGIAVSNARAEMQDLRHPVCIAIDRSNKSTAREGQILIPSEAWEERRIRGCRKPLAKNAASQAEMLGVIHGAEADLPVDLPGIDIGRPFKRLEVIGALFFFVSRVMATALRRGTSCSEKLA